MRLPPVISAAGIHYRGASPRRTPLHALTLRADSADEDDAEFQLADFANQRFVTEVGRVDGERRILPGRWIDAPHRGVLSAECLFREVDRAVVTGRGRILVHGRRRDEEKIAEG